MARWRPRCASLALARHLVLGALPVAQPVYVDNMIRAAGFWTARLTALKSIGLDLWLLVWPLRPLLGSLASTRSLWPARRISGPGWR